MAKADVPSRAPRSHVMSDLHWCRAGQPDATLNAEPAIANGKCQRWSRGRFKIATAESAAVLFKAPSPISAPPRPLQGLIHTHLARAESSAPLEDENDLSLRACSEFVDYLFD